MRPTWKRISDLSPELQAECLRRFTNRYTGQWTPVWARQPRADGSRYPVQYASDAEWMSRASVAVTKDGALDQRFNYCVSVPTWPDNPELRPGYKKPEAVSEFNEDIARNL